jgi:colanic acid/amylovoran biosynthesis protein
MIKKITISTFAVPLSGNKGSASMLLGLMDNFREQQIDVQFNIFSYYPDVDKYRACHLKDTAVYSGHPKNIVFNLLPGIIISKMRLFLFKDLSGSIDALKNSDIVLIIGGTTFSDSMLYKTPWNLLAALPALLLDKKIVFVSQTIGPVNHWLNRLLAKFILRRCLAVHGRGRISAEWASTITNRKAEYRPDLSFAMHTPKWNDIWPQNFLLTRLREKLNAQNAIGIAPNTIVFEKCKKNNIDYIQFLVEVIQKIQDLGYLPVLIPHSYRDHTTGMHNNDRFLCGAVVERLGAHTSCFYLDEDYSPGQLRAVIGQMRMLVASRFHSMISALAMGVPPLTCGWGEQKYEEVLTEFSCTELYVPFQNISQKAFHDKIEWTLSHHQLMQDRIKTCLQAVTADARKLPNEIINLIEK